MSTQAQAKEAFYEALNSAGHWDPAVLLGLLGDKLHREAGFNGSLDSVDDFDRLSDSEASIACLLIPTFFRDLPDLAQV